MPRPRKPGKSEGSPTTLSFQADAELISDFETEIEASTPELGFKPSRTQLLKALLGEALESRRERRKKSK